jgi:hypothetical protein
MTLDTLININCDAKVGAKVGAKVPLYLNENYNQFIFIMSTRFNNKTLRENNIYKNNNKYNGCVYSNNNPITTNIPTNALLFVMEMNNDTNHIEGVGMIRNITTNIKKLKLYDNNETNRCSYNSNFYITKSEFMGHNLQLYLFLEQILFKGKTHLKRGTGITKVPDKLLYNQKIQCEFNIHNNINDGKCYDILEAIINLFNNKFNNVITNYILLKNNDIYIKYLSSRNKKGETYNKLISKNENIVNYINKSHKTLIN